MQTETLQINVKLLRPGAQAPKRATEHSAGWDVFAGVDAVVPAKGWTLVPSGFALESPPGIDCQVRPRSGLAAKHGIFVLNSPGTVDPDYRGEVCVILANLGTADYAVKSGDRIAQLIFSRMAKVKLSEAGELTETVRGEGGFGSSGRN